MNRRLFLGGIAGAAASIPFLRTFPIGANSAALPKLILMSSPNGFLVGRNGNTNLNYEGWQPSNFSGGGEVALPERLPEVFRPLEPHRGRILLLDGLFGAEAHAHCGSAGLLTGFPASFPNGRNATFFGGGPSVDQFLGSQLGVDPLNLAFNIQLQAMEKGERYWCYTKKDAPVTPIQDPRVAFTRVFGDVDLSDAAARRAAEARQIRRGHVLDTVAQDLKSMLQKVPASDRPRIEQHLEHVDKLNTDLLSGPACADGSSDVGDYDPFKSQNFPRVIRDHSRIAVEALACGATQIVTLQCGHMGGARLIPNWPEFDISSTYADHAIAHAFADLDGAGRCKTVNNVRTCLPRSTGITQGIKMQRVYNKLFAELINRLKNTIDTDGRPMIENTLVAHIKPMGTNHSRTNLMWVVAGGDGVGVRGGRYQIVGNGKSDGEKRWVNNFLVAVCRSMGVDVETFGQKSNCRRPMSFD